ncbi:MAG: helix-turn-helix domain-containing protein [Terriglobales bacterium]
MRPNPRAPGAIEASGRSAWKSVEREIVLAELRRHQFHIIKTATALGLERSHLYKKFLQLGIDLQAANRRRSTPVGSREHRGRRSSLITRHSSPFNTPGPRCRLLPCGRGRCSP